MILHIFFQFFTKGPQGHAPVADGVLLLRRQLAEGLSQLRHEEHRVVAEAVLPLRGIGDSAVAVALGLQHVPVGEAAHHRRMEVGGTGPGSPEILQQQPIAGHIVVQAAVAGGVHAGGAVEGTHAQAGGVGNVGRHPRGGEKVLPQGLGKAEIVPREQRADVREICQIHTQALTSAAFQTPDGAGRAPAHRRGCCRRQK